MSNSLFLYLVCSSYRLSIFPVLSSLTKSLFIGRGSLATFHFSIDWQKIKVKGQFSGSSRGGRRSRPIFLFWDYWGVRGEIRDHIILRGRHNIGTIWVMENNMPCNDDFGLIPNCQNLIFLQIVWRQFSHLEKNFPSVMSLNFPQNAF